MAQPSESQRHVLCDECGCTVWVSARNARNWASRRYVCADCRRPQVTLTDEEREQYLEWWRENHSATELARLSVAASWLAP